MATASAVARQTGDSIAGTLAQVAVSAPIPPRGTPCAAHALRIDAPLVLDGRTEDPAWARAQVTDYFLEYEPQKGAEPRFRTDARHR